jgi:hypothetical protein
MNTDVIQEAWNWLVSVGPDVDKAWKGIAAVVAFLTLVGGFIFVSRTKGAAAPSSNQVVVTLTADDLAALVQSRLPKSTGEPGKEATIEEFRRSLDYISAHRTLLEPPPLVADNFPEELDVHSWTPGRLLRIGIPASIGARIFEGLFCLPHYLIFPGIGGGILLSWLTPEFAGYIGAAVGLAFWVRNNRHGRIVSLDFAKRKYSISSPAAWFILRRLPAGGLDQGAGCRWTPNVDA